MIHGTVRDGFAGSYWKLGSVMRGVVVQPDLVVLLAGSDEQGGKVDVRVGGVRYTMRTARAQPCHCYAIRQPERQEGSASAAHVEH